MKSALRNNHYYSSFVNPGALMSLWHLYCHQGAKTQSFTKNIL
jgi:hypothetical protein